MSEEKKSSPWGKILKLFIEFLIAAVTAFATSISGQAAGLW